MLALRSFNNTTFLYESVVYLSCFIIKPFKLTVQKDIVMSLRVHHLNCGSMCPYCQPLINGSGSWLKSAKMVCHCLLIESNAGLILVDTGLGTQDIAHPEQLGTSFRLLVRPILDASETAIAQVKALGFQAEDVRHIILTHLDLDHAGGLRDFPNAKVHVYHPEQQAALYPNNASERARYIQRQFINVDWEVHELQGESWQGFERMRPLADLQDEIALIPLIGHTRGHCGVAVKQDNGWLLHAGDAYFHHSQMTGERTPVGIKVFERMMQIDKAQRLTNLQRLQQVAQDTNNDITVFCAHDPNELAQQQVQQKISI